MALLTSRSSQVFVDLVTNHVTVGKYIKYLCNAFVFYDIKRYDIRGKKYLESSEKVLICVTAVFDMQYWEAEIWIMAEYMKNVVCIELLRRGYLLKDSFFFSKYNLKRYVRNNHSGKQHTDRTNHIVHHIQDILHT